MPGPLLHLIRGYYRPRWLLFKSTTDFVPNKVHDLIVVLIQLLGSIYNVDDEIHLFASSIARDAGSSTMSSVSRIPAVSTTFRLIPEDRYVPQDISRRSRHIRNSGDPRQLKHSSGTIFRHSGFLK